MTPSLSKDESWELFCYAFQSAIPPSDRYERGITKIAMEICEECKGLLLALRVIGNAMQGKVRIEEWLSALRHLIASEGIKNSKTVDSYLFYRLRFSYDKLDESTKKCLLYFAAFPEDEEIIVDRIIAIWRVEELFGPDINGEDVDDVGRTHLLDLKNRSLIELLDDGGDSFEYAKIHDILRDLAFHIIYDAGPGEWASECLFQPGKVLKTYPAIKETVKRMSFMEGGVFGWPSSLHVPNLRESLVGRTSRYDQRRELEISDSFFSSMINLWYLELIKCRSFNTLQKGIKGLKSLNLPFIALRELPEGIKELTSLIHLNLSFTMLHELPEDIKELTSLTHLNLSWTTLKVSRS